MPISSNVALSDTFDQQRLKINQSILLLNEQEDRSNLIFDTTNTVFEQSNTDNVRLSAAYVVVNSAFTQSNTDNVRLSAAYVVINSAFTQSNTDNVRLTSTFTLANATSNNLANTAIAANNYAGFMANSGNSYAGFMANSSNNFAGFMVNGISLVANSGYVVANAAFGKANDAYTLAQTLGGDASIIVTNLIDNWKVTNAAFETTNAAFTTTNAAFTQSNTDNVRLSAAYVVTNAAFASANATANNLANTAIAANNYSGAMANAANAFTAATYLPLTGGTITNDLVIGGSLTVSGTTTYVNTAQLQVGDNIVVLNADIPSTFTATENAGIEINRGNKGNATILWIESRQGWAFTDNTKNAITTYIASNTYADGIAANAAAAFLKANNVAVGANGYASSVGVSANAYTASYTSATYLTSVTGTAGQIFSSGGLTPSLNLISTAVTASTYGGPAAIPSFVVDAYDRITSASNNSITAVSSVSGTAGRITSSGGLTPTIDLATGGAGAGTYAGSGVSSITLDAYGRVTSVGSVTYALNNQTMYIGTTAVTINRASASLSLTGVSIDGNAGSASSVAWTNVSGRPTAVSSFTNDSGYLTGITSGQVTTALGYTPYNSTNPSGYITSSASITGSAATFTSTTQNSQFNSIGVGTGASGTGGEIRATNNITAYYTSDKKFKENIKNIANALNKLSKINGVEFDWTDEYIKEHGGEDGYFIRKHDVGVIAQEIEQVLPEVVATKEDGTKGVKYDRIIALLIEAVKDLSAQVDELKKGN